MITKKELELFDKKIEDNKLCKNPGSKILMSITQQIKDSTNFTDNIGDDWADYNEWDQYSVWSKD